MRRRREERVLGCFLGAALGDALGAAVEDTPYAEIKKRYGPDGVSVLERAFDRRGAITDATQTLLFTAEGILRYVTRATVRGKMPVLDVMVWMAYPGGRRFKSCPATVRRPGNGASRSLSARLRPRILVELLPGAWGSPCSPASRSRAVDPHTGDET